MTNFWKTLPKPFSVLAPMEDVTDYVFREIIAEVGRPDVFFTEFTNIDALASKGRKDAENNLRFSEKQRPIVAQIWGTDVNNFYNAAKLIRQKRFDGIDINMGCPVRAVVKKKAGAGLIKNPKLAEEIIAATKEGAGNLPVSVKTRLGFEKSETDTWIPFLLTQDIAALTVHGRIASEMSKKPANWEEIGKAVNFRDRINPNTKIIGNGDVDSFTKGQELAQKYKVDGVMVARGIFRDLWLFTSPHGKHTNEESLQLLLKHLDLFNTTWGDTKNIEVMKKFFKMYIKSVPGASQFRQSLMLSKSYREMKLIIISFLTNKQAHLL